MLPNQISTLKCFRQCCKFTPLFPKHTFLKSTFVKVLLLTEKTSISAMMPLFVILPIWMGLFLSDTLISDTAIVLAFPFVKEQFFDWVLLSGKTF